MSGRARSRVRRLLVPLLGLPLLLGSIGGVPPARGDELDDARRRQEELRAQIQENRAALSQLRKAEAALQSALAATASQLTEINADLTLVRGEVDAATAALAVVEARYKTLVAQLEHLDWTLGVLEEELSQAEEDLDQRKRLLGQRLAEAYRTQQTSILEQVIASDSFAQVLSSVGAHLRFGNQDAELAAQIQRDEQALQSLRSTTAAVRYRTDQVRVEVREQAIAIAEQRARLQAAQTALEALEAETKRIQAEQMAQFREVQETRAATEEKLLQERTAQVRLKGEIARLIEQQRHLRRIPSEYNGTFEWPLKGRVSQEYGCTGFPWEPPLGRCAHFHRGIDLVAPNGTDIVAPADGVVVFIGYNPYDPPGDRAWIVLVAHAANLITWHGHLQPRVPEGLIEGSKVKSGDLIGWEGNTGRSTGAHLHWGVQYKGRFVNPRLFV